MNKILTYDFERTIRACFAEEKDAAVKETLVNESISLMTSGENKFYKYEDTTTGTLLGFEIFNQEKNSVKKFLRK